MDSIEIIVTNSDSTSSIPTTTHYQTSPNSAATNTTKSHLDFKLNAEKTNGSTKSKVNHSEDRYDDGGFDESKKPLLSMPTSLSSSSLSSPKKIKVLATSSSQLPLPSHSIGIYEPFIKMS